MSEPSEPSSPTPPELPGARFVFALGALCALFWLITFLNQPDPVEVQLRDEAKASLARIERKVRALLASGAVPDAQLPAEVDDEAALARLARRSPKAVARARAAHVPLGFGAPKDADLHHAFAQVTSRVVALDPDWGIHLGLHPHPRGATVVGDETRARYLLVVRDAWRSLVDWPAATPHQETDLALFRAVLETSLRWDLSCRDQDLLRYPEEWFVPLVTLSTIDCCPPSERLAVVISRLRAITPQLKTFAQRLRAPPRPVLESVLRRFARLDALLVELPSGWPPSAELTGAVAAARAGLEACRRQLREVVPRASGPLGVGAPNYAIILNKIAFLDTTPRAVLRAALEAFAAARQELSTLRPPPASPRPRGTALADPLQQVRDALARARSRKAPLPAAPALAPPEVAVAPALWRDEAGEVFYFPTGPLSRQGTPRLFVTADPHAPPNLHALHLRHALARYVTPGQHLQRTLARDACSLRRIYDCKLYQRGWGAYAEELLHTDGGCADDAADRFMRASARLTRAWVTILEVLLHTRAVPEDDLLELLRAYEGNPDLDIADLGFRAREAGLASTEFLGLRALRELVAQHPGPAFRDRYLRAGPVPPRLLARELR